MIYHVVNWAYITNITQYNLISPSLLYLLSFTTWYTHRDQIWPSFVPRNAAWNVVTPAPWPRRSPYTSSSGEKSVPLRGIGWAILGFFSMKIGDKKMVWKYGIPSHGWSSVFLWPWLVAPFSDANGKNKSDPMVQEFQEVLESDAVFLWHDWASNLMTVSVSWASFGLFHKVRHSLPA